MLDNLAAAEHFDNESETIEALSSSKIYQRAWKVMQTRRQVMDKFSIIAILRTHANLSCIQAHTAFYLLQQQGKLRRISASGCFYIVTSPRRHYTWQKLISDDVSDPDFLQQNLNEDEMLEQELDAGCFQQLINSYIDLKRCEGGTEQEYALTDQGRSFIDIDSLPTWRRRVTSSVLQSSAVYDTVKAGIDCSEFYFQKKSLCIGYPVEQIEGQLLPIFYVRVYNADQAGGGGKNSPP